MERADALGRLSAARVAVLSTVRPGGGPHAVPITFAMHDGAIVSAVDHKPKSTNRLQRIVNIQAGSHASVLVHHYSEDWRTLWWVRVDGTGRLLEPGPLRDEAVAALVAKYDAYRRLPPTGSVLAITIEEIRGWSAEAPD